MLQDFGWGGVIVICAFITERALLLGGDPARRPVAGWMVAVLVTTYRLAIASSQPLGHAMGRDAQITLVVLADASVALAVAAAAGLLDLVLTNFVAQYRSRAAKVASRPGGTNSPVSRTSAAARIERPMTQVL
jgi:hypothetical protein